MKHLVWAFLLLLATGAYAQEADAVPMADALRADGKIWVVVATLLIVLIGFFVFLIRLDRRLSQFEKRNRA